MDTSKDSDKITAKDILIAFAIGLVAIIIQHYLTSFWGCLLSTLFLLLDVAWISRMGKQRRKSYDR